MISLFSTKSPVERIGEGALFMFFLTAWVAPALANLSLLLMVLACLLTPRKCLREWMLSPVFWLVLGWNIYLGLRLGTVFLTDQSVFEVHLAASADFFKLSLCFFVGWWARGDERKLKALLLLAVAGILLNTLKRVDWETLPVVFSAGERTGFGMQIPMAALLSGSAVVGLVGLMGSCILDSGKMHPVKVILWGVALLVSLLIVIYTQTRTIWLVLTLLLPVMVFSRYLLSTERNKIWRRLVILIILTGLIGIVLVQLDLVLNRINVESEAFLAILNGEEVRGGSVGLRYQAFLLGIQQWVQQPWFGWGAGYESALMNQGVFNQKLYHLHNTYLEFLVRFGLFGSVLLLANLICLQVYLMFAVRKGIVGVELAITLIGFELVFAVWSLTDFQIMRGYCQMYWFVIGGLLISQAFPSSQPKLDPQVS